MSGGLGAEGLFPERPDPLQFHRHEPPLWSDWEGLSVCISLLWSDWEGLVGLYQSAVV